ncbi:acetyltransferase domain-containing protein [Xylariomycetidae sp. FL2044]|nr:acetyltransferase domain-containing protein [Xylariomycetidae sp. FL2044]
MAFENSPHWVPVKTTSPLRPLPPNSKREPIKTERLLIRPLVLDDLSEFHALRTQPEAMTGTRLGRPDRDIAESRSALDSFLPANEQQSFLFGVFLMSTGALIGEGGVHTLESEGCGWPEIGYKFRREHWGNGYATEFLKGFIRAWWALPRTTVELRVHPAFKCKGGEVAQHVYANADVQNIASHKVLEKVGFVRFSEWTEPDTQEHRLGEPVTLVGYSLARQ